MTDLIIDLLSAGYVNAVAGDIGKQVTDDGVEIGLLVGYDNTNFKWWVTTDVIVSSGSVMTITSGTGAGTSVTSDEYCTNAQIKERLLIATDDSQYDSDLTSAATEAARMIDEHLRPYMAQATQLLTLEEGDYVECANTDIGKQVRDDDVKIGMLIEYDNVARTWKIYSSSTIADTSVISIAEGTGSGTADVASTDAITEQLSPYMIFKTLPLNSVPATLADIAADIAAGIFKRRHMPQDMEQGWLGQGLKKLDSFIKSNFHKGTFYLS